MSQHSSQHKVLDFDNFVESKFLTPFQRKSLLKQLQTNLQPEYRRRIEVMLLADTGKSQAEICRILGCSQHMARYWITVARSGMAHEWRSLALGRPKSVSDEYIRRLKELVSRSPREYNYPFHSWTARWLSKHLARELKVEISERHINRLLKDMGLSTRRKQTDKQIQENKNSGITIYDLQPPLQKVDCKS